MERPTATLFDLTQEGKSAIKIYLAYERLQPYFQFDFYSLQIATAAQYLINFQSSYSFGNMVYKAEYKTQWLSGASLWVNAPDSGNTVYFTVESNGKVWASEEVK